MRNESDNQPPIKRFTKKEISVMEFESSRGERKGERARNKRGAKAHLKGREFEKKVARWAKRRFKTNEVKTNIFMYGLHVKKPYEVDVWVHEERLLGLEEFDTWIDCKALESRVKREHVQLLVAKAGDIKAAKDEGKEKFYFDQLAIASTSKFDDDALSYANEHDVACFYYDGKTFNLENKARWAK